MFKWITKKKKKNLDEEWNSRVQTRKKNWTKTFADFEMEKNVNQILYLIYFKFFFVFIHISFWFARHNNNRTLYIRMVQRWWSSPNSKRLSCIWIGLTGPRGTLLFHSHIVFVLCIIFKLYSYINHKHIALGVEPFVLEQYIKCSRFC